MIEENHSVEDNHNNLLLLLCATSDFFHIFALLKLNGNGINFFDVDESER